MGVSAFRCAAATGLPNTLLKQLNSMCFFCAVFLCIKAKRLDGSGFAGCLVKLSTVLSTDFVGSPKARVAADV